MLTRENMIGPWAGLPIAWNDNDTFDEPTYRGDIERCCRVGIPGVYSGGTTGEFYAMEFDEFKAVARATVEETHRWGKPAIIGCTSTYTLGVIRRARYAAELGADGIQIALPYWMEVPQDQVVPFFAEVAAVVPEMPISIYETLRAKKALTLKQHRAIHKEVPQVIMIKANAGTLGHSEEGCQVLSEFVNVFVGEPEWYRLGPHGAIGCCSALVYLNPRFTLEMWDALQKKDWSSLKTSVEKLGRLDEFQTKFLAPKGYLDSAYDRLGGLVCGFLKTSMRSRGPYPATNAQDIAAARQWCRDNLPELLEL